MAVFIFYAWLFAVIATSFGSDEIISINAPGDSKERTPLEEVLKRGRNRLRLPKLLLAGDNNKFTRNGYTVRQQKEILLAHNTARRLVDPTAADMYELIWNRTLADMAQRWSDSCWYEHPNRAEHPEYNGIGQNLYIKYMDRNQDSPPNPTIQPVILWYDEDEHYLYEFASCEEGEICGHYTQMVWAKTTQMGCGMAWCDQAETYDGIELPNAWLVTCNYSPGGNYYGQKPYKSGRPCAECPNGFCKHGLCSDCDSSDPDCVLLSTYAYPTPTPTRAAHDINTNTDTGVGNGVRHRHQKVCMLECNNCGSRDDRACTCSCAPGFHGVACEKTCEDTHAYCGANPGWPTSWCNHPRFPFVDMYCPKMCGHCSGDPEESGCYA